MKNYYSYLKKAYEADKSCPEYNEKLWDKCLKYEQKQSDFLKFQHAQLYELFDSYRKNVLQFTDLVRASDSSSYIELNRELFDYRIDLILTLITEVKYEHNL